VTLLSSVDDAPVAAIPGDTLRAGVLDQFRAELGDALVESHLKPGDDLWLRIRPDAWRAAGTAARRLGFDYFCFLSAIDWMPSPFGKGEDDPTQPPPERDDTIRHGYTGGESRFQLLARVGSLKQRVSVIMKADVPADPPVMESWVPVYAGANWHERETWEMFGITFAGHPDLRHMYLPMEFEGFPLRKDFPLLARIVKPWPGIVDVEPLPGVADDEEADAG
jgi:NADH-quinone oxidoreductase subunit C